MQERIIKIIQENFNIEHINIENDSHLHAGPNSNSHFKLLLVSNDFNDLKLVKRHQKVYKVLQDIMQEIHALQLNTFTTEEWQQRMAQDNTLIPSSQCAKT